MSGQLIYTGKAKSVYETEDENLFELRFRDDLTAFNGAKTGSFPQKGAVNNQISASIFTYLEKRGVYTHFVKVTGENSSLVKKVEIIPLEVIIRNRGTGSFSKRYGVERGASLLCPVLEFSYKNDDLGDPMINSSQIMALGIADKQTLDTVSDLSFQINDLLTSFFGEIGLELIDFKLEFGRLADGRIVLADEITPDSCRLWDQKTGKNLDKDLFREGHEDYEEAYREVLRRIQEKTDR